MKVWRMAFRDGTNGPSLWADCSRLKIAAIQYTPVDDIDLSQYPEGEPKSAWSQLSGTSRHSLHRFVHEMKAGHIIYVKDGPKIVGKGVIGPYKFDTKGRLKSKGGTYWQHQRPVKWITDFPEVVFQLGTQQIATVKDLSDEEVARLEKAVGLFWLAPEDADENESNNDPGYVAQDSDRREIVWQQIRERRGQKQFRDALLQRYEGGCLVTGCKLLAVLEAAHIDPYRGDDNNHPQNGLLLRADIHTLFDLDLLGIDPNSLRVKLHPDVADEYRNLAGKTLRCTGNRRPSRDALKRRYEQFAKRVHRPA